VPYVPEPAQQRQIRLAWRALREQERRSRRLSAEELAKLPPHMRQDEVCERGMLPYHLRVSVDETTVVDEAVRAGGARADRPLFVFHELPVTPGMHHLSITFEREPVPAEQDSEREVERDHRRETPRRLTLDETVRVSSRAILLVTYDDEQRRLRLLAAPPSGP
ncbi:MAG: hypothetical protein ACREMI_15325, partial [Gemmatimonadales bacterium]